MGFPFGRCSALIWRRSAIEANQNTERLQAEIGRLQGKIEEMEHQRRKEIGTYNSTVEGNAKNVNDMKAQLEEMQKTQAMLFEELKRQKEENLQLLKNQQKAPAPAPSEGKKKSGSTNSFQNAYGAYAAKDWDTAITGFRAYLEANPKGKKVRDARYFLGDSLYKNKDYADAIVEFGVLHESAAGTTVGRKSTLRIAQSFKAMGKDKDAKAFAQLLVGSAPDSKEAQQARKYLK